MNVAEVRILRFFLLDIQIEHIYSKTYMETNIISVPRFGRKVPRNIFAQNKKVIAK